MFIKYVNILILIAYYYDVIIYTYMLNYLIYRWRWVCNLNQIFINLIFQYTLSNSLAFILFNLYQLFFCFFQYFLFSLWIILLYFFDQMNQFFNLQFYLVFFKLLLYVFIAFDVVKHCLYKIRTRLINCFNYLFQYLANITVLSVWMNYEFFHLCSNHSDAAINDIILFLSQWCSSSSANVCNRLNDAMQKRSWADATS